MAGLALAGLIGPQVKDYAGSYAWSYACCGQQCEGKAELAAADGSGDMQWTGVSGSFVPAPAKKGASRDGKQPHWFVAEDGGVWVMGKPKDPLKYYSSEGAAAKGVAPTVTAMRRGGKSGAGSSSKSVGGASGMPTSFAEMELQEGTGYDGARKAKPKTKTQREQAQDEANAARQEKAELERKEIAERIAFAKEKDRTSKKEVRA